MEEQKQEILNTEKVKNYGMATYIVAGMFWVMGQSFNKGTIDEFIIMIVAIGAGLFYYRLKRRIKIKNEAVKIVITFIILEIIAGFLIGALTTLV